MQTELKRFFEENGLAIRAAHSIKDGREIAILVTDGEQSTPYTFAKERGRNSLREGAPSRADLTFTIPVAAAQEILSTKFETVGQVGLRIFEKMLSHDPTHKIRARIHAGFLSLLAGGYLGVLASGGVEVARFLASKGLGSAGKIKDAISRMKGAGHA